MNVRLSRLFALLMVAAMLVTAALPVAAAPLQNAPQAGGKGEELSAASATRVETAGIVYYEEKGATGPATYIVQLVDEGLATYRGGIAGLPATAASATGEAKLNTKSAASEAYLAYLDAQREAALKRASEAVGREIVAQYEYKATLNGFAAEMTPEEAAKVAALPNVKRVERERQYELHTDAGPAWIGAPGIWDGSMTGGLPGTYGEGIIVGVIDTGIDPWNPSFAATGDDGYTHENPYGAGNYVGVCDPNNTDPPAGVVPYDPTFPCNDKLIGVWGYTASDPNPRDANGHGSHTASTAAGNFVNDAVVTTPTGSWMADISGVAPHANIIMYDGCIDGGGCPGASLTAARDQALLDGVDAINYSIGSGSPSADPWNDIEEQQWLALRDAGVFVATSAGNAGPGDATIGSPGDVPWITTVAASSHDRKFLNSLTIDDGVQGPLTLDGEGITGPLDTPAPVVFSIDYADPDNGISVEDARLCADGVFPAGTFNGEIVVCERGTYGRVAKGATVAAGGAGGYVLAQPDEFGGGPGSLASDPHVLPGVHIDYYTYQDLLAYFDNAGAKGINTITGTISGASLAQDDSYGDVMAAFSSRGANRGFFDDLVKPSVTAPGRSIWAAYHQGAGGDGTYTWNVIQGTSMSSPHVAGAGALMKALYPGWTPAQIESALMSTAYSGVLNDDGVNMATWFAQGSGRVDLGAAANAGFVLDVTEAEYQASDPRAGGDPRTLNMASLGNGACVSECTFTRTLQSTMDADVDWTTSLELPAGLTGAVEPANFTLAAGGEVEVTVTVNVSEVDPDQWYFGDLMFMPVAKAASAAHFPIAVQSTTGDIPGLLEIVTRRDAGSELMPDLTAIPITDMTFEVSGLALAEQYDFALFQDPSNGDPYDNLDDVWWMTFEVPEDAGRIVAQIIASTAPDIDLFWGAGDTPSAATQLGSSTSGSWPEYLSAQFPPAGTYWVLVQNWAGSAAQPDAISMVLGVVGGDAGNMWVEGPAAVDALEPFDLRVYFDEMMAAGQYWYGAFTIGSDPANPGNVGVVDVNLRRIGDDVTKTADVEEAAPGDTVLYTIEVMPNDWSPEDLTYMISDTIPAGMTYVPGSAAANMGEVMVDGNMVYWTGVMAVPSVTYAVSTSENDPACTMPLATNGAYVNLEAYGILANSAISGDTIWFTTNPAGGEFTFFDEKQGEIINFTDDGFTFFDPSTPGGAPWVAEPIPTAGDPDNLQAPFWRDMEVVYDAGTNRGVSLANLTSGGVPSAFIIEYDDVEDWPAGSGTTYDFEALYRYEADDAWYEYIFAYDNLNGDLTIDTSIGLENFDGSAGVQYGFGQVDVMDGMAICFDQMGGAAEAAVITYEAKVNAGVADGSVLTNNAVHKIDALGSIAAVASDSVTVVLPPDPTIMRSRRYNVSMDTFIDGTRPDANFGDAGTMWAGYQDLMRPVVWADIPVCDDKYECIPSNSAVDAAYLYVYVTEGRGFANWNQSRIDEINAHAVLSPWMEDTATWMWPWANPGGDVGPALDGTHLGNGKIGTWLRFDVTEHMAKIVSGEAENYGFALATVDDTWDTAKAINGVRYGLASSEYWDPGKVGYIRVMYRTYTALDAAE